jgi:mono/diheme cytochrome c family protein
MMLKCFKALALLVVVITGGLIAYIYSGLYDVAATHEDGAATRWLFGTVRRHSIHARLDGIQVPALTDPKMVEEGFVHYHAMCEECHLAPGMGSSETRAGLNPQPPILADVMPHTTPAELFWVIKNGIRMTGMPAWGITHDDQKIWAMVAFIEQLPKTTPAQYQALEQETRNMPDDDDHPPAAKKPGAQ